MNLKSVIAAVAGAAVIASVFSKTAESICTKSCALILKSCAALAVLITLLFNLKNWDINFIESYLHGISFDTPEYTYDGKLSPLEETAISEQLSQYLENSARKLDYNCEFSVSVEKNGGTYLPSGVKAKCPSAYRSNVKKLIYETLGDIEIIWSG